MKIRVPGDGVQRDLARERGDDDGVRGRLRGRGYAYE